SVFTHLARQSLRASRPLQASCLRSQRSSALTMTRRTTRQNVRLLDVMFRRQRLALRKLFFRLVLRSPLHIENFFLRSDKSLGIAVTLEAPLHLQRRRLIRNRHLVDSAMT